MGRADIEVANRGVDGSSRPRRPCYPRGNFSVMPGLHQGGHERSLGQPFSLGSLAFKDPIRQAFGLALYNAVLTRLSLSLGACVIFSQACRPSRTAHLPLSRRVCAGKGHSHRRAVFHYRLSSRRNARHNGSRLLYASAAASQRQTAVKLHGVFSSHRSSLAFSPGEWFHRALGRDSRGLVGPFMHVGTYPTRHLATCPSRVHFKGCLLRESELLPAFGDASPGCTRFSRTASGQDSAPVQTLTG